MVTVKTKGLMDGIFTKFWKYIYIKFSENSDYYELDNIPFILKKYFSMLSYSLNKEIVVNYNKKIDKTYNFTKGDNRVIVGFSGGKDSLACVIKLLSDGYKPILFFVDGINKSYTDEIHSAKHIAEQLGLELYIYKIQISSGNHYTENPIKNQLILSLMVDYGIKFGITKYAFGSIIDDKIDYISSDYMLSDCYDLFLETEKYYKQYIDDFELIINLKNETESFCVIASSEFDYLLYECISCITPIRYRKNLIKKNNDKYSIILPKNRCGSCYKCCQEALITNEICLTNYDSVFIKHCYDIINKTQELFDKTSVNKDEKPWIDFNIINKYC